MARSERNTAPLRATTSALSLRTSTTARRAGTTQSGSKLALRSSALPKPSRTSSTVWAPESGLVRVARSVPAAAATRRSRVSRRDDAGPGRPDADLRRTGRSPVAARHHARYSTTSADRIATRAARRAGSAPYCVPRRKRRYVGSGHGTNGGTAPPRRGARACRPARARSPRAVDAPRRPPAAHGTRDDAVAAAGPRAGRPAPKVPRGLLLPSTRKVT